MQVDAEGSLDGTVIWVAVVLSNINLLTIFLVLLLPPLELDVVGVHNWEIVDGSIGELSFP